MCTQYLVLCQKYDKENHNMLWFCLDGKEEGRFHISIRKSDPWSYLTLGRVYLEGEAE
jgi:hypothetical protein